MFFTVIILEIGQFEYISTIITILGVLAAFIALNRRKENIKYAEQSKAGAKESKAIADKTKKLQEVMKKWTEAGTAYNARDYDTAINMWKDLYDNNKEYVDIRQFYNNWGSSLFGLAIQQRDKKKRDKLLREAKEKYKKADEFTPGIAARNLARIEKMLGEEEFDIVKATYGTQRKQIDVTEKLNSLIKNNRLEICVSNDIAGDPDKGRKKTLTVQYQIGEKIETVNIDEGCTITFPIFW